MKKTKVLLIAVVPTFLLASSVLANHTPEESRTVVRFLLDRAQRYANANLLSDEDARYWQITPDSWQGFLMPDEGVGWTLDERKEAFASYLGELATNDCRHLPRREQRLVQTALVQCEVLGYTNSIQALKGLAFNTNGVYRSNAIELAVKFMKLADETTCFVENIMTNHLLFAREERAMGGVAYEHAIRGSALTNEVMTRAMKMFYRQRFTEPLASVSCDLALSSHCAGYATSSNRLDYACWVLGRENLRSGAQRHFTSVTNELISSGQPLRWINVGGDE